MPIRLERQQAIARIIIDTPPMNTIDTSTQDQFLKALEDLAAEPGLCVLILTGTGGQAFCAGADLRTVAAATDPYGYAARWDELYRRIREFPCPTVAAVNGHAFGGGFEVLLNTDLRVAAQHARMGCTAANIGLVTSLHSLAAHLPMPLAKELFFTARHLTAAETQALGLINRVVPAAELDGAVEELVTTMLGRAPLALREGKRLLNLAPHLERTAHDDLQAEVFGALARTEDHGEGVRAFLEKRSPRFRGR